MSSERFTVELGGCSPQPLGAYLKALGALRLVAEQADPDAEGYWQDDVFFIRSSLDEAALMRFLVEEYLPTSVMAPWNGGSGFYPKDNSIAIDWIRKSGSDRFAHYRAAIHIADGIVAQYGDKPSKDQKEGFLQECRAKLPDETLDWLDAAFVLGTETPKYPPLLGTGGNDGRLEFTNNFMQRLMDVIDSDGQPTPGSPAWLRSSLFGDLAPGQLRGQPIGQFNPSGAGGPNSSSDFEGGSLVNPWDYLLMIEGSLLFACGIVKRGESNLNGELSYPFSVRASGAGYGTASKNEEKSTRAELWVPIWSAPVNYRALRSLFSEGRSNVERRRARDGTDFVRAVATLGVDRGIDSFQRFGFLERNGRAYFAVPLGRFMVRRNPQADLLASIDGWLARFRSRAEDKEAPASVRRVVTNLDNAIIQLCTEENAQSVQSMLITLGECERVLGVSSKWTKENHIPPIPPLRADWFLKGDDGTPEYRIAASVALLSRSFVHDGVTTIIPIRSMVESAVIARRNRYTDVRWSDEGRSPIIEDDAVKLFNELMNNGLKDHLKQGAEGYANDSPIKASAQDVLHFLSGGLDDGRIVKLFRGLVLLDPFASYRGRRAAASDEEYPGSAYSLLKLCHVKDLAAVIGQETPGRMPPRTGSTNPDTGKETAVEQEKPRQIPLVPEIHRRAMSGDIRAATQMAARRLRGSGFEPRVKECELAPAQSRRIAASLIIPLDYSSIRLIERRTIMEETE